MPDQSPPPAVQQTNAKAYVAGIVAAIVPILLQNLTGANEAFATIWNWIACGVFGTVCPDPQMIADAFKSIGSALFGGAFTGFATWWINNKPK